MIPPDPAVVEGERLPGDAFADMENKTGVGVGKGKGREQIQNFLQKSREEHIDTTQESNVDYFTSGPSHRHIHYKLENTDDDIDEIPLRRDFVIASRHLSPDGTEAYELTTMEGTSKNTL